ncbi:hypothetical protein B1F69_22590 [Pseudomonas syringae]|nr:hypothetical protein B1F69_22590 [Pseudomonas syringae]SOQ04035.1 hypothetical protein CFBP4215_04919 [Pseudomonas syringae pv. syringae]
MGLLPGGRGSELARELSGTDSETVTYGTSGTTEVAGLAAGPRQFANKFAPTPCGQNQERTCDQRLREQVRSYALRAESVYRPDQAASRRFAAGAGGVATLSVPSPEMGLLPGGRASELSGTDSETVTYGTSGTTEVAGFAAGPRQFASKFLRPSARIKSGPATNVFASKLTPTPCGQNQERTCVSRPIRLLPGVLRLVQGA